ncbi:fimbria/pilus outer membrane usher protein [Klebsiella oxytoca]|uniref:fimbria/pilus outer membrane usher protein n=1 Tax=Klebsiella oxytoca TaxID=571 RepID=UPI002246FECB|nr:fimbria/pilus outer membrane usher protein [Klebsiella oxytoca]MCW9445972.1 fimbria/pilus outer membrane usher protein [Klebsiella oxytoca]
MKKTKIFIFTIYTLFINGKSFAEDKSYELDYVKFNLSMLSAEDKKNINLDTFSKPGSVIPGQYILDVLVNNVNISNGESIVYKKIKSSVVPCLTEEIVHKIGFLDKFLYEGVRWDKDKVCLDLIEMHDLVYKTDLSKMQLNLYIPDQYLVKNYPNWTPSNRWDNGVTGLISDYTFSPRYYKSYDGNTNGYDLTGYGTVGINFSAWRFRADWQGSKQDYNEKYSSQNSWDWTRFYAYRPLEKIAAKLSIGESVVNTSIFDSLTYTGIGLASQENMLPPNLRGYAPQVSGIAKTNAKVSLSQDGRILLERIVPAGAFTINDLAEYVSGRIDVKVEEQDGTVQRFYVDASQLPYLTRPGQVRYNVALGNARTKEHKVDKSSFILGEGSWGVSNDWSLYGGSIFSSKYNNIAMGIGKDLYFMGAMSFDISNAMYKKERNNLQSKESGRSFRLSYSKRFNELDSQINFAGYRFSQKSYKTLNEFLDLENGTHNNFQLNSKEMFTITGSKYFKETNTNINLNYSKKNYWNGPSETNYMANLSQFIPTSLIGDITLSLSLSRTRYKDIDNKMTFISMSVPLGKSNVSFSSNKTGGNVNNSVNYFETINDYSQYQLSVGNDRSKTMFNGMYSRNSDYADLQINTSYSANQYSSIGGSLSGGLTATPVGITFHRGNYFGGSRIIVDTDGVSDIPVSSTNIPIKTNRFGNAVLTGISPYVNSLVRVNVSELADDVEVTKNIATPTLTEGAIAYQHFDVIKGEKAMLTIYKKGNIHPPFGATVYNEKNREIGIVTENGMVYVSGLNAKEKYIVKSGSDIFCQFKIDSLKKIKNNTNNTLLCQ